MRKTATIHRFTKVQLTTYLDTYTMFKLALGQF